MKQQGNTIKVLGKDNALWVDNQRLRAAIERVRELHKPSETLGIWDVVCSVCMEGFDPADYVEYPCDTIKALGGEQ